MYIIRHSKVNVVPETPSDQWHLSEEGKSLVSRLASMENWDDIARIYHSPEHKAFETAKIIADEYAIETRMENDLHELRICVGYMDSDRFHNRVGAYLDGYPDPDFEDYQDATTRIVNCVKKITAAENGKSVAVVSHGRILTVLFSYILGRKLTKSEWLSIGLPDLSVIDTETWKIKRGLFSQGGGTIAEADAFHLHQL